MIKLLIFTLLATAALGAPSGPKLPQEIDGPEAMELWSREGYMVGKPEFVGIEARALNKNDEKRHGHYTKRSLDSLNKSFRGPVAQRPSRPGYWGSGQDAPLLATALEVMS